jgi:hypothetical protein
LLGSGVTALAEGGDVPLWLCLSTSMESTGSLSYSQGVFDIVKQL